MISSFERRTRLTIVATLSVTTLLVFLHLCSGGIPDSKFSYLSGLEEGTEQSVDVSFDRNTTTSTSSDALVASPTYSESLLATPTPTPISGAIVAAVGMETDMDWISEITDPMWKLHRYNYDDPSPPPETYFPVNKGNEAMMFLSYVINNYDSLPDYSIFIHGHRISWHQEGDMVAIINSFRLPALDNAGYAPLRCDWYPSCPSEIRPVDHDAIVWGPGVHREDTEYEIGRAWTTLFGNDTALPRTIASQCCAQFALTRKAIQDRPKAEYERMRQWLIETELISDVSGRVFEKLWAYIFTKESVRCPAPQQCACEYFGQCGAKLWPVPPEPLMKWSDAYDSYMPEEE
ncbi:hypothetical protein P280DRAFT_468546 [Massarina eburnea CBS 473.64]|uniref:Uncharacterized protein n=1 Tax=Massarina eburnea CBS 473.64 TaxID=1395130 RepID=A0A6A6S2I3_9PLEO|nr:hypothetical protein P280DRAFT_468546 [Massarina eburnea CBS 473.64]